MPEGLKAAWRDAAWTAHEGEGMELDVAADAAVRVVLEHLDGLTPSELAHYSLADVVHELLDELEPLEHSDAALSPVESTDQVADVERPEVVRVSYLALARLTVGADARTHRQELADGLERVVEEMVHQGWTPTEIERAFEDACMANEVEL